MIFHSKKFHSSSFKPIQCKIKIYVSMIDYVQNPESNMLMCNRGVEIKI